MEEFNRIYTDFSDGPVTISKLISIGEKTMDQSTKTI